MNNKIKETLSIMDDLIITPSLTAIAKRIPESIVALIVQYRPKSPSYICMNNFIKTMESLVNTHYNLFIRFIRFENINQWYNSCAITMRVYDTIWNDENMENAHNNPYGYYGQDKIKQLNITDKRTLKILYEIYFIFEQYDISFREYFYDYYKMDNAVEKNINTGLKLFANRFLDIATKEEINNVEWLFEK